MFPDSVFVRLHTRTTGNEIPCTRCVPSEHSKNASNGNSGTVENRTNPTGVSLIGSVSPGTSDLRKKKKTDSYNRNSVPKFSNPTRRRPDEGGSILARN